MKRLTRISSSAAALATALAAACAEPSSDAPGVTRTDSTGVEIVQSSVAAWETGDTPWTVASQPMVRIGEVSGDEAYLFGSIAGVVRLPDGGFAVADAQTHSIRFYAADGTYRESVGRAGEGPGEFDDVGALQDCGGRLYSYDWGIRRISIWSYAGKLERTFTLLEPGSDPPRPTYERVCGPSGAILAVGWGETKMPEGGEEYAFVSQGAPLWILDAHGAEVARLPDYLSSERLAHRDPRTGHGGSGPHPFGRAVSFSLGADVAVVGTGESLSVDVYDLSGSLIRVFRGPPLDLEADEAMLDRYRSAQLPRRDSVMRARVEAAGMLMPPSLPVYDEVRLDPLGNIWLQRFQPPWERVNRWAVFGADGAFLGQLEMPLGFRVDEVGVDYVLGVSRDDLDVERVELYALERGRP